MATIKIKRVYEPRTPSDGVRILVDRLWPRGLSKERAHIDFWLKDIAPSNELRKYFAHDPKRWPEFKTRYLNELKTNKTLVNAIKNELRNSSATITLLFAAHDLSMNNATVLKQFLS